jgi:hypothetical protein
MLDMAEFTLEYQVFYIVTDLLKALRNSGHMVPQQVTSAVIAQR